MNVFLDDQRKPPEGWLLVKTVPDTINLLKTNRVKKISLDHDLGNDTTGTGYDVLLWIEKQVYSNNNFKIPIMAVHSSNSSARIKMELAIKHINKVYKFKH